MSSVFLGVGASRYARMGDVRANIEQLAGRVFILDGATFRV
jgi:hypothetical protein